MPFVKIKGATSNFGRPENWDPVKDGECGDLWVRVDRYGRYKQHNFAWQPSQEELALLSAGGAVEVHLISQFMPPVGISVVTETEKENVL